MPEQNSLENNLDSCLFKHTHTHVRTNTHTHFLLTFYLKEHKRLELFRVMRREGVVKEWEPEF